MADWTTIPDTSLDPDAPARSIDAKALRDNPVAIAEGAPGAPRINGAQGQVVTRAGIFNNAVNIAKIETATASTSIIVGAVGASSNTNITLNRGSFFPMIHASNTTALNDGVITGHSASSGGSAPRFGVRNNNTTTSATFTIAHEYIVL